MSSVPSPVLGTTGYQIPAEADILSAVLSDLNAAFGGGLNLQLDTPQGQFASSLAVYIADKNNLFLDYTTQVDPNYAQGRMQDGIGYIYFLARIPARSTVVSCTCTGLFGTVIPAITARAKDQAGNLYFCATGGTIGAGGTVTLDFEAVVSRATPCPAGTLDTIYGAIPGWDTIINAADGVLGNAVETSYAFETRRKNSVAINALGNLPSIYGAVAASGSTLIPPNIPVDVYVTENVTSAPLIVKGVTLKPHSVYVAVVGGDPASIAEAIWQKKSVGCDYNGNVTVEVEDITGYEMPYPTYEVSYQVPTSLPIKFLVTLAASMLIPPTITTLVQTAIVNAFSGLDGGPRAHTGADIYASRFYAPVAACSTGIEIVSILVGETTANANSVSVQIDEFPTIAAANIQVVVA